MIHVQVAYCPSVAGGQASVMVVAFPVTPGKGRAVPPVAFRRSASQISTPCLASSHTGVWFQLARTLVSLADISLKRVPWQCREQLFELAGDDPLRYALLL